MPNTNSTYGPDRGINTVMQREPLKLEPPPDFWATLREVQQKAPAYQPRAQVQKLMGPRAQATMPAQQTVGANPEAHTPQRPVPPIDYSNWTSRNFGHPSMSPQGVLGTYVNPMDVPLSLQGQVNTGFTTDDAISNYLYSPTVNASLYRTGTGQRERAR